MVHFAPQICPLYHHAQIFQFFLQSHYLRQRFLLLLSQYKLELQVIRVISN
jgi:hypothetical protein